MTDSRAKLLSASACVLIPLGPAMQLVAGHGLLVFTDALRWILVASLGSLVLTLFVLRSGPNGLARCNAMAIALIVVFYGGSVWQMAGLFQAPAEGWITPLTLVLSAAILILLFLRQNQARLAIILAAWSGATILVSLFYWVYYGTPQFVSEPARAEDRRPVPELEAALGAAPNGADMPDILYIVPDRYGSGQVLAEHFGYDNSRFLDELRKRGFQVAPEARSNYPHTPSSLASSLNMQQLTHLDARQAGEWGVAATRSLFQDNLTQETLARLGYRHVHAGNWWLMTVRNRNADVNYAGDPWMLNEFERMMLKRTPLWDLANFLGWMGMFDHPDCQRLKSQIEFLSQVGAAERPTFTFAHLFMPHQPRVMDGNGDCVWPIDFDAREENWDELWRTYVEFLKYTNTALLEIVDAQLARNSGNVVIVIQADEGPWPREMWRRNGAMTYGPDNAAEMRMKFGILNAIYLPGEQMVTLDPDSSPVNNMRIVLSHILGVELPLLPNRSYTLVPGERSYEFRDITDILTDHSNR